MTLSTEERLIRIEQKVDVILKHLGIENVWR